MITGSLQKKRDMYYAVLGLIDESTGKRRQKWISTGIPVSGNNKRRADAKLREITTEYEQPQFNFGSDVLFIEWLWMWMEQKKNELRVNSYEAYELYIKLHIEPYFTPLRLALDSLTPQHIQSYYNAKHRPKKGKGLSANSIKRHHAVIHGALKEAVKKNLLLYNPADRVTLPKIEQFIGKAYTREQANNLLQLLKQEPLRSAVILGLFYGLRRSEVCGLRWRDIDFDACTLRICNTVVKTKTLIEHEKTKSRASKRTMLLIPETIPYLKELQEMQIENERLCGNSYVVGEHVCVWPDGRPVSPDYVSKGFRSFLLKNNLPIIRFHELRHTAGSLLLEKGLSAKQIQEYLGHEKVSTTLDIYGHLSVEGKAAAAQTMDSLLEIC